jgi:hypothetical protein
MGEVCLLVWCAVVGSQRNQHVISMGYTVSACTVLAIYQHWDMVLSYLLFNHLLAVPSIDCNLQEATLKPS